MVRPKSAQARTGSVAALGLLLAAGGCHPAPAARSAGPRECTTRLVTTGPIRGVIFSAACGPTFEREVSNASSSPVVGYWQPTTALVGTLEARLRPALEHGRTKPESVFDLPADTDLRDQVSWGVSSYLGEILEHFTEFRCQYIGIVVRGGARRVLLNCFPEAAAGLDTEFDFPDWQHKWVDAAGGIDDGGPSYWRIQYDVASCRFVSFDANSTG
jgi:hypothetical protein